MKDTISLNDHIQDVFYGVSFGASQQEVKDGFERIGLYDDPTRSFKFILFYGGDYGTFCSFGGMDWSGINVMFNRAGQFNCIIFHNSYKNRASAVKNYQYLVDELSKKYDLKDGDRICIAEKEAEDKKGRWLGVSCDTVITSEDEKAKEYEVQLLYGVGKNFDRHESDSSEL